MESLVENRINKTMNYKKLLSVALLAVLAFPSIAADKDGRTKAGGVTVRIGAGAPANFNIGAGYQFSPHFSLTAEVFSYSGLTAFTGALDARYYFSDKEVSPFLAAKAGYGTLGTTYELQNYNGMSGTLMAGARWHRFDLGAGCVCDSFHKMEFIANLSWTYCFGGH